MKKFNIKKLFAIIGVIGITAGLLAGCGGASSGGTDSAKSSDEPIVIRTSYWDYAPWAYQLYIAREKGFFDEAFKDENVELEITAFTNGPAANEAVTAGKLDFIVSLGDQPFLTGLENGVDTSILATTARQEKTLIFVAKYDSEISSVADLKSKKIAVAIGTYTHKSLLGVLKDNGVSLSDVELVNFTTAGDVVLAISRGDVDAYLGSIFDLLPSIKNGEIKQIGDITGYPANTYLVGTNEFINKYPEITQKLVNVLYESAEYIRNNPDEINPIIAENSGIDLEVINELFPKVDTEVGFTDVDFEQIKKTEDFLLENDFISEKISDLESSHINTTFIENVLKGVQ